jgi:hypothetical protein
MAADYSGDEEAATAISPLKTITPIAITPLGPLGDDRIEPREIGVRPLTRITDVQIAPLTPPDRR